MHDSIVRDNNLVYNPEEGINIWGCRTTKYTTIQYATCLSHSTFQILPLVISELLQETKSVYKNNVENAEFGVASFDTEDNVFSKNTFVKTRSYKFYLWRGSEMEVEDQAFTNFTG
jgi:hypothetical protein